MSAMSAITSKVSTGGVVALWAIEVTLLILLSMMGFIAWSIGYHSQTVMLPFMKQQTVLMEQIVEQGKRSETSDRLIADALMPVDGNSQIRNPIKEILMYSRSADEKLNRLLQIQSKRGE